MYNFYAVVYKENTPLYAVKMQFDNRFSNNVNRDLKFDPENAVLAAQRHELMGKNAEQAEKKLEILRKEQEAMNKALAEGKISDEHYRSYIREVQSAEKLLRILPKHKKKLRKTGRYRLRRAGGALSKRLALCSLWFAATLRTSS